jgi:hypothetical protein
MPKSPLELVVEARISQYRERALAGSSSTHRHHPGSSVWRKLGQRRRHDARKLAATDAC